MAEKRSLPLSVGNVLLCDSVRPEINGKVSILGVYAGDILVADLGGHIQLALYAEVYGKVLGKQVVDVALSFLGRLRASAKIEINFTNFHDPSILTFPSFPLELDGEGEITVDLIGDGARKRIMKKKLRKTDVKLMSYSSAPSRRGAQSRTSRKKKEPAP